MEPQRSHVRVRVINTNREFLDGATVLAVSSTGERVQFHREPSRDVFAEYLQPGSYSVEVQAEGLEAVTREIEVTERGAREVFVLGNDSVANSEFFLYENAV